MNRHIFYTAILCAATLLFVGCYHDTPDLDLQKPVFIDDAENPGLPIISELGYNTFGAYYNSKVWVSPKTKNVSADDGVFIVGTTEDSTVIHLEGTDYASRPLEIDFLITKNVIVSDDDLVVFGKRAFNLSGDSVKIKIGDAVIKVQSGSVNFSSVRTLILDQKKMGTILSGTFEMTGMLNGNYVHLEKGRFDLLVKPLSGFYDYIGQW